MMMEGLDCMLMDVETAFLYGEIKEEIYMEVPGGMKEVLSNHDEADEENTHSINYYNGYMVYINQQDNSGKVCQ